MNLLSCCHRRQSLETSFPRLNKQWSALTRTAKCKFLMHNIINAMARDWILPLHACTVRTAQQYQYACMCMVLIASAELVNYFLYISVYPRATPSIPVHICIAI